MKLRSYILLILVGMYFSSITSLSSQNTMMAPQSNSPSDLDEISLFAYISELTTWTVGASQYGVTEVTVSFNFTMYNRRSSPQVVTYGSSCEFAPHTNGTFEIEDLTFSNYYTCLTAITPVTYPPGATNRSLDYYFQLSEPGYTELPNGSYRFDIFDPEYHSPFFPTFGVTLILNETGVFRLYDEIPSSLFSPISETTLSTEASTTTTTTTTTATTTTTTVPNPTSGFATLILMIGIMGIILLRRSIQR